MAVLKPHAERHAAKNSLQNNHDDVRAGQLQSIALERYAKTTTPSIIQFTKQALSRDIGPADLRLVSTSDCFNHPLVFEFLCCGPRQDGANRIPTPWTPRTHYGASGVTPFSLRSDGSLVGQRWRPGCSAG